MGRCASNYLGAVEKRPEPATSNLRDDVEGFLAEARDLTQVLDESRPK